VLTGNRAVITDNSKLVVQPGLGITNLCALDMTYSQIQPPPEMRSGDPGLWALKRVNPSRGGEHPVLIRSLAAQTFINGTQPISRIYFQATPNEDFQDSFRGSRRALVFQRRVGLQGTSGTRARNHHDKPCLPLVFAPPEHEGPFSQADDQDSLEHSLPSKASSSRS